MIQISHLFFYYNHGGWEGSDELETDIQELCIEWKSGKWRQVLFGIYQKQNKRGANLSSFLRDTVKLSSVCSSRASL